MHTFLVLETTIIIIISSSSSSSSSSICYHLYAGYIQLYTWNKACF
jgi:hypothetical protein